MDQQINEQATHLNLKKKKEEEEEEKRGVVCRD